MKITTFLRQGILIACVEGEIDVHSANSLRQTLDKALDDSGSKHLLLNLANMNFIDSSGLGVLLGRYKKVSLRGGKIAAIHPQPQVKRILELAGLLKIIGIHHSEKDALELLYL